MADKARGQLLEVRVGGPARGKLDQVFPVSGEGQLEDHTDDAVVVVLDLPGKSLAGLQDDGLDRLGYGRALVADVSRSLALKGGLRSARGYQATQNVEADFFAHVVLD